MYGDLASTLLLAAYAFGSVDACTKPLPTVRMVLRQSMMAECAVFEVQELGLRCVVWWREVDGVVRRNNAVVSVVDMVVSKPKFLCWGRRGVLVTENLTFSLHDIPCMSTMILEEAWLSNPNHTITIRSPQNQQSIRQPVMLWRILFWAETNIRF
jgi:hypothetical protein